MPSLPRPIALTALAFTLAIASLPAQDFGDLSRAESAPRPVHPRDAVPGKDYPLLELDSNFKLIGAKTTLFITENGARRQLGVLDQGLLRSFGGIYSFKRDATSPILATLDWKDVTLDPAGKLLFRKGDANGPELGRVRQRVVLAVGTGLDIYRTGERPVGYVDEKAGQNLQNVFLPSVFTRKYYSFERLAYRDVKKTIQVGVFKKTPREVVETITDRTEAFRFLGAGMKASGPAGVFVDPAGKPILAVKGDWWLSKHIFDLVVRREEAEGAAGSIAKGIGILLVGETDEEARRRRQREKELVRNPSAYLGAFLAGLVYFPDFRELVGVKLPIAE